MSYNSSYNFSCIDIFAKNGSLEQIKISVCSCEHPSVCDILLEREIVKSVVYCFE